MPRPLPDQQLQAVERAVARFANGASVSEVLGSLRPQPARRSLQRWLALLVADGRLLQQGQGRMARYHDAAAPEQTAFAKGFSSVAATPASLAVSPEAEAVRALVRRPLTERNPVGYAPELLKAYRPNHTHYLPAALRKHLAQIGVSRSEGQLAGTHVRQVLDRLLIDLSWNSSRLEGNTYSLLETERLLQQGAVAEGKNAEESQMILNHKRAIELLVQDASEIGFNRFTLLNLHAALAENLLPNPAAAGRLREIAVGIDGSVFHPIEGPQRIEEMFALFLKLAQAIQDPFEQAFFSMVHLPYLQPFEDVNKRVSRLATNIPFIRLNLSPLSFVDVPQRDYVDGLLGVYELNRLELLRDVFQWAYERSCARYAAIRQALGEPDAFRLRHRALLGEVVADVVTQCMTKTDAVKQVRAASLKLAKPEDQGRFAEMAEKELIGLHEGNFARFRISPSQFEAWRANWK